MHVVLISGTSNQTGPTAMAVTSMLTGIHAAGGVGQRIVLPNLHIQQCRHCHLSQPGPCQAEGSCEIDDDFEQVVMILARADAAVIASPVYLGGLAGSVRAFLHRLQRVRELGTPLHGLAGTPAVGVCVGSGFTRQGPKLRATLDACGFTVLDILTAPRRLGYSKSAELRAAGKRLATEPSEGLYFPVTDSRRNAVD